MTKRLKYLIGIATVTGIIALGFGDQIANTFTARLLLLQDAPDPIATNTVFEEAALPGKLISQFWNSEKIPHRYLAVSYLKEQTARHGRQVPDTEGILDDAVQDVDNSVRELALGALSHLPANTFIPHLRRLLKDADNAIKIKALHFIKEGDFQALASDLIVLLDDPEPLVVASTAGLLRRWTGEDFSIRNHDAVAKLQASGPRVVPEENLQRLRTGVIQWKEWWQKNKEKFPQQTPIPKKRPPKPFATKDFELHTMEGDSIRLSDFRGKKVLLNFWTTWCTACAMEMPDLVELNERYSETLVILGISLDGSDGHGHDHASFVDLEEASEIGWNNVEGLRELEHHDHEGHDHDVPTIDLPRIKKKIRRIIDKKGLTYPILLNPSGDIGRRFNGQELPTNVLIDQEGKVRRRFIGSRPIVTWEAMLKELD